jgi:hypothetical protein
VEAYTGLDDKSESTLGLIRGLPNV